MPTTLGQARSDLRSRLNEASATFWQDSDLNNWINEGVRDVAKKAEPLQQLATVSASAGVRTYILPVDIIRVHKVEYVSNINTSQTYPMEYRGLSEMDAIWGLNQQTLSSYPTYWTVWFSPPNLQMIVFPVPAGNGSFNVWYYRLPVAAASDSANLDLPEGWQEAVILYAEYIALRKDRDPNWKDSKELYQEQLSYLIDRTQSYTDSAGVISTGTAQIPYWLYSGDQGV